MKKQKRVNSYSLPGVVAVEVSGNRKLGLCSTTYVAQRGGCSDECPMLGNGCYYEYGPIGIIAARLNLESAAHNLKSYQLMYHEAECIEKLTGRLPLRLHGGGDCRSRQGLQKLEKSAVKYTGRHNQPVFTYTHSWKKFARHLWGKISVLASCETMYEVACAMGKGYAACITLPAFPNGNKAFRVGKLKVVPCPEQSSTAYVDCSTCRMCMDADKLLADNTVIAFAAHGSGKKKVQATLELLQR